MAKESTSQLSTKKKTQMLFLSTFMPLITLALVICTLFALLSGQIARYYVRAELSGQVEKLGADTMERLDPAIVNVELFAEIASQTQDPETLGGLLSLIARNLKVGTSLYYGTELSRYRGGGIS